MKIETIAVNRKDVVKALEELIGQKSKYLGPPSFAYQIGEYIVNRDGIIETELEADGERIHKELVQRGLAEEAKDHADLAIPINGHTADSIKNLIFMSHSKQYLLEKAVGQQVFRISKDLIEELQKLETEDIAEVIMRCDKENCYGLEFDEHKIHFTGFPYETEHLRAFMELVCMMASASQNKKRVTPKETIEENEKYYMRVWLMRIGLGGKGGKDTRTALMQNLKGHSAFRTEEEIEKAKERNKAKKQAAAEE